MKYSDYSYSATTQAKFYEAEVGLLRLGDRLANDPCAKYMKDTLLAFDAVFAIYTSYGIAVPAVSLIIAFDLVDWKYRGNIERSINARYPEFQFPEGSWEAAEHALRYMQAISWIAETTHADTVVTMDTVLHLHEILLSGKSDDNRYHGFRRSFLPYKKGADPSSIPSEVNDLCRFMNGEFFSPLGQASAIHHAFERIVPFDTLIDRTGLALAFLSMFKRGLFLHGYMPPICWGASYDKAYRRKLRDASRDMSSIEQHERFREDWALYNARNTHASVVITDSFLAFAGQLRKRWRSQNFPIPTNSALDRLMDLFLSVPGLSTIRAAEIIGKSYGATNEAMRQLTQVGMIREIALDGRERVFVCEQSMSMIAEFMENLIDIVLKAEASADGKADEENDLKM